MNKSMVALLPALVATPVAAQQSDITPFVACSTTADAVARAECYDRAVAAVSAQARANLESRRAAEAAAAATRARQLAEAKASTEAARRAAFGRETLPAERRPADPDAGLAEIAARLAGVNHSPMGAQFTLDNGMVWRQADAISLPPVRAGMVVVVRRGTLGSFEMRIPQVRRLFRVVRVR